MIDSIEALKQDIANIEAAIAGMAAMVDQRDRLKMALSILVTDDREERLTEIITQAMVPDSEVAVFQEEIPEPEMCRSTFEPSFAPEEVVAEVIKRHTASGGKTASKAAVIRDTVVEMRGQTFTLTKLAAMADVSVSTAHSHIKRLLEKGVIKEEGKIGLAMQYSYNSDIPAGPTEHPREPTPESLAVGAVVRGPVSQPNGAIRVSDKTIQSFMDAAVTQGWVITHKNGNHYKFKNPDGRTVGVNAKPNSPLVAEVIKRDLKRCGLVI